MTTARRATCCDSARGSPAGPDFRTDTGNRRSSGVADRAQGCSFELQYTMDTRNVFSLAYIATNCMRRSPRSTPPKWIRPSPGWPRRRDAGRAIFVAGNGGSAATAAHFVCDMVKGASHGKRTRFRIQALAQNLATLTAYSNDVSYARRHGRGASQLRPTRRPLHGDQRIGQLAQRGASHGVRHRPGLQDARADGPGRGQAGRACRS